MEKFRLAVQNLEKILILVQIADTR